MTTRPDAAEKPGAADGPGAADAPGATAEPGVLAGMEAQLEAMAASLHGGARRVGWKVGLNAPPVQEALGITRPVIGHLTSATLLAPPARFEAAAGKRVGAEPEIAVRLGSHVPGGATADEATAAITALGPAIEIVDVDLPFERIEPILAGNVFHRGLLLGDLEPAPPASIAAVTVTVRRGEEAEHEVAATAAMPSPGEVVAGVSARLAECGQSLQKGDLVICGSLTPIVFVDPGDRVEANFGPLGALAVTFG